MCSLYLLDFFLTKLYFWLLGISNPTTRKSFILLMAQWTQINGSAVSEDELNHYLADNCVPMEDPLWWWVMNWKVYPNLSKLAISVHLIPGAYFDLFFQSFSQSSFLASSLSIECTFSHGHILIPHLRNRLHSETVCALMCFGDWSLRTLAQMQSYWNSYSKKVMIMMKILPGLLLMISFIKSMQYVVNILWISCHLYML